MLEPLSWQVQPLFELPEWFVQAVSDYTSGLPGRYLAQLLWQRGVRDRGQLAGFLGSTHYSPSSPFEFGQEMHWAVERLQRAWQTAERVVIWGDFDADGITATAVLWEGLGQFWPSHQQLAYYIPNRLTESHGLSIAGIAAFAAEGYSLIVTCDTGSTNREELEYAHALGIDVIVTDHHSLPAQRPPVVALINPRCLPIDHPLAHLSGVAVAYKLVEACCQTLPDPSESLLENLLDLVAIGLIADLVELKGDCRYLAQRGIERLQHNQTQTPPPRPGVARLLELCKRNGDRPTDISFGLGPRINAISRIQGDARFCVELLTSQDRDRCYQLAEATELANSRRKSLQRDVVQQVSQRLAQLDLSTTSVIVLADPQWSVGILGLVAGQIAQTYQRPTILLSLAPDEGAEEAHNLEGDRHATGRLARGSARSVNQIDLYDLVAEQAHLLHRFGGHPFAMGLSLPVENISLFAEAINRRLRQQLGESSIEAALVVDLSVTVAELGKDLFRELKLLEPCGIGNPAPRLLIQNCWFNNLWNRNIQDCKGRKIRYIKTEFEIWDDTSETGFPGLWWDHYKDEIPAGRCDAVVELDFNAYKKRYEVRLVAVRSAEANLQPTIEVPSDWLLDWRCHDAVQTTENVLLLTSCPSSWDELYTWFRRAIQRRQRLAIAYSPPDSQTAGQVWRQLVGIAKYLSRTGKPVPRSLLCEKLGLGDRSLQLGFRVLERLGFEVTDSDERVQIGGQPQNESAAAPELEVAIAQFIAVVQEEQFRQRYFYEAPLTTLYRAAAQAVSGGYDPAQNYGAMRPD